MAAAAALASYGHVVGTAAFAALRGRTIQNATILVSGVGDLHPFSQGPIFEATTVIMDGCDKNAVFYWLTRATFPRAERIVLRSHPCEPDVLRHWGETAGVRLELEPFYWSYKERWARGYDNIIMSAANMPDLGAEEPLSVSKS